MPVVVLLLVGPDTNRFSALKDAVTETEPSFRDDLLGTISVVDLLTEPVNHLADRWRA